ncbi:MAG: NAD-dependent epimerase/dehydratase family protein, partial [Myxococcales bacterium]|nr:NAD-dependent epimerase/dehydratase family protein [Myxococcales bacterium]
EKKQTESSGARTPTAKSARPRERRVVAVTGAAGFLGGQTLKLLDADPRYERLVMMDVRRPRDPIAKGKFFKVDLTEPSADAMIADILAQERVDTMVHCAFLQSPVVETSYAHELESIGTLYVLNAVAECDVPKIVVPSTTLAYGALPSNPNFLEEDAPLQAAGYRMLQDRVEIERQLARHRKKHPDRVVTVLRPCLTLGPNVVNFTTRYMSQPVLYRVMGHDPLMQFVHEEDVLRAMKLAIDEDHSGVYNVVGRGVLPLSTLLKLAGKPSVPLPAAVLYPMIDAFWVAQLSITPSAYLDYIRYLFVADGRRAAEELGFEAKFSTKETLLNFMGVLRLKRFHLLGEEPSYAKDRLHQRKRRVL